MNDWCVMDKFNGKMGCRCSGSLDIEKASSVNTLTCKKCGKILKTNRETDLCFSCEKRD